MDARLKQAKAEGRTALIHITSGRREPWSPWFVSGWNKLLNVPKEEKDDFELYMATRRTRFNPHEVFTVRVLLPKPLAEYPDDVALYIYLTDGVSQSQITVTAKLHPDV